MSSYDYTFKILLLGDASTEKSALTKRYCYNIFNPSERLTIGVDFHVKTIEYRGNNIKLQIWDVGGDERFKFLLPTYCLGANAAFLLYDITRPQTLDRINEWVKIVRQRTGPIPIMLIGTNLDLEATQRQVPRDYGVRVAEDNELCAFAEVSAKTGQNVNSAFGVLTELAMEQTEARLIYNINKHLSLRLENNNTNVYVGGRLFRQCKYLLLDIPKDRSPELTYIDSIDEAEVRLNKRMHYNHSIVPFETEFWGHCSNLQAWYENGYDTRILHRNIAFPLLRELVEEGDHLARKVFKEEIAKRFESGYPSVVLYLIEENYLNYLNGEELDSVIENPRFLKNLLKWFMCKIPKDLTNKILKKLKNLHCPYCGSKIEENVVQKISVGKGIRCVYCHTCIIEDI